MMGLGLSQDHKLIQSYYDFIGKTVPASSSKTAQRDKQCALAMLDGSVKSLVTNVAVLPIIEGVNEPTAYVYRTWLACLDKFSGTPPRYFCDFVLSQHTKSNRLSDISRWFAYVETLTNYDDSPYHKYIVEQTLRRNRLLPIEQVNEAANICRQNLESLYKTTRWITRIEFTQLIDIMFELWDNILASGDTGFSCGHLKSQQMIKVLLPGKLQADALIQGTENEISIQTFSPPLRDRKSGVSVLETRWQNYQ